MKNEHNDGLQFENEFLKLKLTAESGAVISSTNLPPLVENEWLKYIMAYEEAAKEKRMIKVFDRLERPAFSLNVSEENLSAELDRLLDHMHRHRIEVCTLCEVEDRELYRFIVEELFEEDMADIHHEKAVTTFTYEEFHPNHPYDIGNRIDDFMQTLLKKDIGLYSWVFSSEFISSNGMALTEAEVTRYLNDFFDRYASIKISESELKQLHIDDNHAIQNLFIKIEALDKNVDSLVCFEGEGKISLVNDFGWWCVSGVNLPGLKI